MSGVTYRSKSSPSSIEIVDSLSREQVTLTTETVCELSSVDTERFPFGVTDAFETTLSGFELEDMAVCIRDFSGQAMLTVEPGDSYEVPPGEYILELFTPVKLFFRVSGGFLIAIDDERTRITFPERRPVAFGLRPSRRQPLNTIVTTDDPHDVMTALSCLGAGLQTNTPDRSYSTVRNHPPAIDLGSELSVPEDIAPHDSPVVIEIPPRLDRLYTTTSLAYYLDASVEPGERPRLLAEGDPIYEFPNGLQQGVEQLLPHVFLMDCLVRRTGFYPYDVYAHEQTAEVIPFEPSDYYESSPAERLQAYLSVPFEDLSPYTPTWPITAHVEPQANTLPTLPYLADQLAFVRSESPPRVTGLEAQRAGLQAFMDGGSTRAAADVFAERASFVDIEPDPATETDVWVGEDIPLRANELLVEGYRNRHRREPIESSTITVTVICNESWMSSEAEDVRKRYGTREELPIEVQTYDLLSRSELAEVLQEETDFLHYVGHAKSEGLECTDGYLDVGSVSSIGADMFFLNACQSYRQACKLVEGGCIGGIATLSDVIDEEAARVGRTTARLLDLGFPLRTALDIARERAMTGGQYFAVGDQSASLVQVQGGTPVRHFLTSKDDTYELSIQSYTTNRFGLGSWFVARIDGHRDRNLVGKRVGPIELSREELRDFFELEDVPVDYDGEFYWASELAEQL